MDGDVRAARRRPGGSPRRPHPARDEDARLAAAGAPAIPVPQGSRGVLGLQRLAGNAAVSTLLSPVAPTAGGAGRHAPSDVIVVQRAGQAPTSYAPPDGMAELGVSAPNTRPLGETRPTGAPAPRWHIAGGAVDGQYEGTVQPVTLGTPTSQGTYPAPGLYNLPPSSAGRPRQALIEDDVSDLVRDGEQEHSDDYWWAFRLTYEPVVEAINQLAARPAIRAANVREVHRAWREALRALLPPALRFPLDQLSPTGAWSQVYSTLLDVSYERDRRGWHSMGQGFATYADRQAHNVPDEIELLRVLPNRAGINVHSAEQRLREAFGRLPEGGA